MAFKIKDGVRIGDVDVLNNQGQLLSPKIKDGASVNTATLQTASLTGNRTLTIPNTTGTIVTTGDSGTVTSAMIADGTIVNGDISASAAIADTKLDTISTSNKVAISALNIAGGTDINAGLANGDLIIVDDGAGGTLRKSTVDRIPTYVFTKVSGDITIASDGTATIGANSVALGTDTTGNYVSTVAGTTNQITVTGSGSETASVTLALPQDIHTGASPTFAGLTLNGNLSLANVGKVTNLVDPTASSDAATKAYVDSVASGLQVKQAVIAATTNTLATLTGGTVTYNNGTNGVGATLTLSSALTTLDSRSLNNGDRILVKNEATAAHNGIYVRTSSTVLTRATDYDTGTEVQTGDFVFVTYGNSYAGSGWVQLTDVATIGTDSITWDQFSGSGTYTAGTGLTLTGSEFSVNTNLSHVTGLGTITSGTWHGDVIGPIYGGTGVNNGTSTITLGGSLTTSGAHTLTLTTTGNTSVTLPTTGTLAVVGEGLDQFAATTSAELAGVISDETGSGKLVFGTSPTISTSLVTDSSTLAVFNTVATTVTAFSAATSLGFGANTGTTTVNNSLVVSGNLTVNGTTTTVNTETVIVKDKNIELANVASPDNSTANGGGITVLGGVNGNKTFSWTSTGSNWASSENISIASGKEYKINNVSVLSSTTLGSSVVNSSLTSVGTITSGTWNGTIIAPSHGGTGVDNGTKTVTLGGNLTTSGAFNTTLTVTGATTVTLPTSGTLATTGKLSQFAATSSSELAGVISDETGTGVLVYNTTPSFVSSVTTSSVTFSVFNTTATTINAFGAATTLGIGAGTGTTTVNNNLTVAGDLVVQGSTTTLNTATLEVEDKNIVLANVASPTNTTADGAGITVKGTTDKTFNWVGASSSWTSSENMDLATGKEYRIDNVSVLSSTTLGSNVVNSSLTKVGTITTGIWNGTTIAVANGGTGATTAGDARTNLGATTVGSNLFTLPNPSAVRFLRVNANNTVSALTAAEFRAALGGGAEGTTAVATTSPTPVDTFEIATYRSAKYVVQITQGSNYQVSEIMVIHNGTTTYMTEYAVLETNGALATFTSDISSGNARLIVNMASAADATVKLDRTTLTV